MSKANYNAKGLTLETGLIELVEIGDVLAGIVESDRGPCADLFSLKVL
jgi:hypothetical protein